MNLYGRRSKAIIWGSVAVITGSTLYISGPGDPNETIIQEAVVECADVTDYDGNSLGFKCVTLDGSALNTGPYMGHTQNTGGGTTTSTSSTTTEPGATTTTEVPAAGQTSATHPVAFVATPGLDYSQQMSECVAPNCLFASDTDLEPNGAFRIACTISHVSNNDSIVYYDQQGVSHEHMFFGNPNTDHRSTYESLRLNTDNGSCSGGKLNNSAYWAPTMRDADGSGSPNVGTTSTIIPHGMTVYYKGEPGGYNNETGPTLAEQQAKIEATQPFPNGLRMIAGYGYSTDPTRWKCSVASSYAETHATLQELYDSPLVQNNGGTCPNDSSTYPGQNAGFVMASLNFPPCWDGVNLDTTNMPGNNHQDHMAYPDYQGTCPATHPVRVPSLSQIFSWRLEPGEDFDNWFLSSDAGNTPGTDGGSWHNDVYLAWDEDTMESWVFGCIRGMRSSNGNLCNDPDDPVYEDNTSPFWKQQLNSGSPGITASSRLN